MTEENLKQREKISEYYNNVISPLKTLKALSDICPLTKSQLLAKGFTLTQIDKLEKKQILIKTYNVQTNLCYYHVNGDLIGSYKRSERKR